MRRGEDAESCGRKFSQKKSLSACIYTHNAHTLVVARMQHAHSINAAFSTHAALILLLRSGYR
jgi:hypothetical protein